MTTHNKRRRRRRKHDEKTLRVNEARRRDAAEAIRRRRLEQTEAILLGLDDGTSEAALNEEVDFSWFVDMLDEEHNAAIKRAREIYGERPMLTELKRHRERIAGHKIEYK